MLDKDSPHVQQINKMLEPGLKEMIAHKILVFFKFITELRYSINAFDSIKSVPNNQLKDQFSQIKSQIKDLKDGVNSPRVNNQDKEQDRLQIPHPVRPTHSHDMSGYDSSQRHDEDNEDDYDYKEGPPF